MNERIAVVIPVFNPGQVLLGLCNELCGIFRLVLVVDDGSVANRDVFTRLPSSVAVIAHSSNCGKGRAIKTALKWILDTHPECEGAVFVDADGQHRIEDVRSVARRLTETGAVTFGVRDFSGTPVPFRSRFGNVVASLLVRLLFGLRLKDSQTGLRGIPSRIFARMLTIRGERYEYEMGLFGLLRENCEGLVQVPIGTVYEPGNEGSHFRPVRDSLRVVRSLAGMALGRFLRFSLSGLLGFVLDNAVFTGALFALQAQGLARRHAILISLLLARVGSAVVNCWCNRVLVFSNHGGLVATSVRYAFLAVFLAALSYAGTAGCACLLDAHGIWVTVLKIVVEAILFVLSYYLQKRWVFG